MKQKHERSESSQSPDFYHELMTPLATIQSLVDMLVDGLEDQRIGEDQQKEYLTIIVKNCHRLEGLFDDIQAEIEKKNYLAK